MQRLVLVLYALVASLQFQLVFGLQLVAFLTHPSRKTLAFAAIAQIFSQVALTLGAVTISQVRLANAREFVGGMTKTSFEPVDIALAVSQAVRDNLHTSFITPGTQKRIPFLRGSLEDIRIYVLRSPIGALTIAALTTYFWSNGCFLFITDHPNRATPWQKFALLHELGHSSRTAGYLLTERALIMEFYACTRFGPYL